MRVFGQVQSQGIDVAFGPDGSMLACKITETRGLFLIRPR
jgi:hypothetical protein